MRANVLAASQDIFKVFDVVGYNNGALFGCKVSALRIRKLGTGRLCSPAELGHTPATQEK
jgi:hypothetical protein